MCVDRARLCSVEACAKRSSVQMAKTTLNTNRRNRKIAIVSRQTHKWHTAHAAGAHCIAAHTLCLLHKQSCTELMHTKKPKNGEEEKRKSSRVSRWIGKTFMTKCTPKDGNGKEKINEISTATRCALAGAAAVLWMWAQTFRHFKLEVRSVGMSYVPYLALYRCPCPSNKMWKTHKVQEYCAHECLLPFGALSISCRLNFVVFFTFAFRLALCLEPRGWDACMSATALRHLRNLSGDLFSVRLVASHQSQVRVKLI